MMDRERAFGAVKNVGGRGLHATLDTVGDFRKFILRGNVVDLAVGVVIGAAFTAVVSGMVEDFFQPLIGSFLSLFGVTKDLASSVYTFHGQNFKVGHFLTVLITFLLTALVVYFFVVKPVNSLESYYARLRPKKEESPTTRDCPFCLSSVPLKATRCAYCTAQLPPAETSAASV